MYAGGDGWTMVFGKEKEQERKAFYEPAIVSRNRTYEHVKRSIFPPVLLKCNTSNGTNSFQPRVPKGTECFMLNTFSYKEDVYLVFVLFYLFVYAL